jgi:hypothetical protein
MRMTKHAQIRERIAVEAEEAKQRFADHPPACRSESETARLLAILEELETEEGGQ